jgi:predicted Ser/Thr protein kinase
VPPAHADDALSRLSEELVLWMNPRFGFIRLADRFCTGSSIMPQKKNPDVPELARGKTGRVYGHLTALLTLMKGQPLAYNKDNQEDKEPLFDAIDTVNDTLRIFVELIPGITTNPENMRDALRQGFATATDLADYLTRKGLPFRDAHAAVGLAVRRAEELGVDLAQLSLAELQRFSPLIGDDVFAVLTIDGSLAARITSAARRRNRSWRDSRARVAARHPTLPHTGMEKIGKYELVREIGHGATSTVYLGSDPFSQREVAVKVAFPDILKDPERGRLYTHLFLNEAALVGKLSHPHIVQTYDAVVDDHLCYIVMEYVAGGTLETACAADRLLSIERIVEIIFKCTRALDFAFRAGIIHRDIKPANILVRRAPTRTKATSRSRISAPRSSARPTAPWFSASARPPTCRRNR